MERMIKTVLQTVMAVQPFAATASATPSMKMLAAVQPTATAEMERARKGWEKRTRTVLPIATPTQDVKPAFMAPRGTALAVCVPPSIPIAGTVCASIISGAAMGPVTTAKTAPHALEIAEAVACLRQDPAITIISATQARTLQAALIASLARLWPTESISLERNARSAMKIATDTASATMDGIH